uniref:Eukaryotic translation initiation factor 3 subunit G N-terminal domain-containing protein n=1 Tax=Lactuca sativa TaxID=4236 RepID=A0A9R1XA05_LACSA|nr:hypothetical protein LSAT_V11C500273630 [Lactuca sativa]
MAQKPGWGELEEEADGGDYDYLLPPKQVIGPDEHGLKVQIQRRSKRAMERRSWPKFGDAVQKDVGTKLTMVSTEEIIFERPRAPGTSSLDLKFQIIVTILYNYLCEIVKTYMNAFSSLFFFYLTSSTTYELHMWVALLQSLKDGDLNVGGETRTNILSYYYQVFEASSLQIFSTTLLKQQGAFAKGQTKTAPVEEEVPPLLGENGKIEVWRIDGEEKTELPKEDIGKFYKGDCYICLYSYHSDEKKEDHYLCCWIGKDSIQEDQKTAVQQTTSMFNSMKCKPVQVP